jgi:hypothetical protein
MRFVSFAYASFLLGCSNLVKVDVDCPQICMTAQGPTLPGLDRYVPAGFDAAAVLSQLGIDADIGQIKDMVLDAGSLLPALAALDASPGSASAAQAALLSPKTIEWNAKLEFNQVLKQLPIRALDLSANVQILSVHMSSSADLAFVDAIDVYLTRQGKKADAGTADGGVTLPPVDGGTAACKTVGSTLHVASFRRAEGIAPGPTIGLSILLPDLNIFDCLKDAPASFTVKMDVVPAAFPFADIPLSLGTCMDVQTHVGYP